MGISLQPVLGNDTECLTAKEFTETVIFCVLHKVSIQDDCLNQVVCLYSGTYNGGGISKNYNSERMETCFMFNVSCKIFCLSWDVIPNGFRSYKEINNV